jgi:hypothetical protein
MQVAFTWNGTVGTAAVAHLFTNEAEHTKVSPSDGSGPLGYANTTNQPFRIGNADFDFPGPRNITIKSGFFSQTKHPVVFVRPTHPLAPIEHL